MRLEVDEISETVEVVRVGRVTIFRAQVAGPALHRVVERQAREVDVFETGFLALGDRLVLQYDVVVAEKSARFIHVENARRTAAQLVVVHTFFRQDGQRVVGVGYVAQGAQHAPSLLRVKVKGNTGECPFVEARSLALFNRHIVDNAVIFEDEDDKDVIFGLYEFTVRLWC